MKAIKKKLFFIFILFIEIQKKLTNFNILKLKILFLIKQIIKLKQNFFFKKKQSFLTPLTFKILK